MKSEVENKKARKKKLKARTIESIMDLFIVSYKYF
jgi:hypothetical protein